jgi:hypothetical protein
METLYNWSILLNYFGLLGPRGRAKSMTRLCVRQLAAGASDYSFSNYVRAEHGERLPVLKTSTPLSHLINFAVQEITILSALHRYSTKACRYHTPFA